MRSIDIQRYIYNKSQKYRRNKFYEYIIWIIQNILEFRQRCDETRTTTVTIIAKFEINLKMYIKVTRHLLQTYI